MKIIKTEDPISQYKIFNPYSHLSQSSLLRRSEWERIKSRLSDIDLMNIENGGRVKVGRAAYVWKARLTVSYTMESQSDERKDIAIDN